MNTTQIEDRFAEVRAALHDRGSSEATCRAEAESAAARVIVELGEQWSKTLQGRKDYTKARGILKAMEANDFQEAVRLLQSA